MALWLLPPPWWQEGEPGSAVASKLDPRPAVGPHLLGSSPGLEAHPETRDAYPDKAVHTASSLRAPSRAHTEFSRQCLERGVCHACFMKVEMGSERLSNSLKVPRLVIVGEGHKSNSD